MMDDRYLDDQEAARRLLEEKARHGSLFVAFDFDNTVYDYHQIGDTYKAVRAILRKAKKHGHKLILFTANEGERLEFIKYYCENEGFGPDYINESPIEYGGKPYYNILLDDRAGLSSAYHTLNFVLNYEQSNDFGRL